MGVIIGLVCVLVPFTAVHSMIISTAARLCGIRPPAFFEGMGISFVLMLANGIASLGLIMGISLLQGAGSALEVGNTQEMQQIQAIGGLTGLLLVGPIMSALVFSVMLQECTFFRGLGVWLAQFFVVLFFCLVIAVIAAFLKPGSLNHFR